MSFAFRLLAAALLLAAPAAAQKPRLVVVISIDQFGSNLFEQWRGRYDGGLGRMAREGVVYASGYQAHAATETCPGHSTILTGKHPANNGIAGNDWYDEAAGADTYCLLSTANRIAHDPAAEGRGPERLRASTLGDWLKAASPASRVVGVAGKDRSAIAMAGHRADATFWYAGGYGFTTYVKPGEDAAKALAPLDGFNAATRAAWTRNPPLWSYGDRRCAALEADHAFGETRWRSQLPPTDWDSSAGATTLAAQFAYSPMADELTLDAARALVDRFELGRDDATDVLTVGLSATDAIGHRYGTAGPEMCDQMGRLDRSIGAFVDTLAAIDPNLVVVVTADHGGMDFVERLQVNGYPQAQRLDGTAWLATLNAAVRDQLDLDFAPLVANSGQLYVVRRQGQPVSATLKRRIVDAAVAWAGRRPEVAGVYRLDELLARPKSDAPADELSLPDRLALSAVRGRSGDVLLAFRPLTTTTPARPGTVLAGHGTPWTHDRRVPILFWTPGGGASERPHPIRTIDIAPTLANLLGIAPPADLDGRCLDLPFAATRCAR